MVKSQITWPEGKTFAFSVFDDTDFSTLENTAEVYAFLADCGLRTTKSVWPDCSNGKIHGWGSTCGDSKYLDWVLSLQSQGFEIGYHMAKWHSSLRRETIQGLDTFSKLFSHYPRSMANHTGCAENIYWGSDRLTGINRTIYNILTKFAHNNVFRGHIENDGHFWGDFCKNKITYVRNFAYSDINTLKMCPSMPYHDPNRPYVNYWFASSNGGRVHEFNECLREENQDRLEEEGGACIMYTHFGYRFYRDGKLNPRFRALMERLSKKNGWFVPASTILDYLLKLKGHHEIGRAERTRLERQWLRDQIRSRITRCLS